MSQEAAEDFASIVPVRRKVFLFPMAEAAALQG